MVNAPSTVPNAYCAEWWTTVHWTLLTNDVLHHISQSTIVVCAENTQLTVTNAERTVNCALDIVNRMMSYILYLSLRWSHEVGSCNIVISVIDSYDIYLVIDYILNDQWWTLVYRYNCRQTLSVNCYRLHFNQSLFVKLYSGECTVNCAERTANCALDIVNRMMSYILYLMSYEVGSCTSLRSYKSYQMISTFCRMKLGHCNIHDQCEMTAVWDDSYQMISI